MKELPLLLIVVIKDIFHCSWRVNYCLWIVRNHIVFSKTEIERFLNETSAHIHLENLIKHEEFIHIKLILSNNKKKKINKLLFNSFHYYTIDDKNNIVNKK